MANNVNRFIRDLNDFFAEYRWDLPTNYLPQHGLNSISDIGIIIGNALEGKKENGLDRLQNVRNYLQQCLDHYRDVPEFTDDDWDKQMELEDDFENLIEDLEPNNFAEMANIMTPDQIIATKSWLRQYNFAENQEDSRKVLPTDVQREVLSYVGKVAKGGRRKKGTKKRRTSKSKRIKKYKVKRTRRRR